MVSIVVKKERERERERERGYSKVSRGMSLV